MSSLTLCCNLKDNIYGQYNGFDVTSLCQSGNYYAGIKDEKLFIPEVEPEDETAGGVAAKIVLFKTDFGFKTMKHPRVLIVKGECGEGSSVTIRDNFDGEFTTPFTTKSNGVEIGISKIFLPRTLNGRFFEFEFVSDGSGIFNIDEATVNIVVMATGK